MPDLLSVQRRKPSVLLAGLKGSPAESKGAALKLAAEAADVGLGIRDFLTLACDPHAGDGSEAAKFNGLNGYEAALMELNLPSRNNFEQGVLLQAASETFQTYPGSRLLFPEVIDDMLRWKNRQDQIEQIAPMISQSRTISGSELISTVVNDDSKERGTYTIAEGARIPIRTIKTSQTTVGIYKHGSGFRTTYEFNRRVSLDIFTPFASRVARELELSKVTAATGILLNGDGVNAAAPVIQASTLGYDNTKDISTQYKVLVKWLMDQAKAGVPVDTIVGGYDLWIELLFMFVPTLGQRSEVEALAATGKGPKINLNLPILNGNVNFVVSSAMPDNQLIGYTKAETLEELVEANSSISENERAIENQTVTYVKTENSGFKLAMGDTRSVLAFS